MATVDYYINPHQPKHDGTVFTQKPIFDTKSHKKGAYFSESF